MKVLLYFQNKELISKSGVGRAFEHQKKALTYAGVEYTDDPEVTDYDILHINTYLSKSMSTVRSARRLGKKVIYHAHSTEEDFRNSFTFSNLIAPFYRRRLIRLYSSADALITPTPYSKKILEGYGLKVPIYAISNGIDLEQFRYDENNVRAFREYFNLSENQKVVISVGLAFKRKGLLDFIEIAGQMPEYRFIWFGNISRMIIPPEISKAIDECPPNVTFPGFVDQEVLNGAYSACDCFFFPSYEENEGIVILEALAARAPILIRDIGTYETWLEHGVNCYKGSSNGEFMSLLRKIVDGRLPDTTEEGYKVAEERDLRKVGEKIRSVYESVLESK